MEESGSEGLDDLIFEKKDTFFKVCRAVLDMMLAYQPQDIVPPNFDLITFLLASVFLSFCWWWVKSWTVTATKLM